MTVIYLNISRRESKLDEIMKDIETCKTNYLLGGQFWYPFQSLEVNKEREKTIYKIAIGTIKIFRNYFRSAAGYGPLNPYP